MKNGSHAEPLEYAYALEVSHLINRNCAAAYESAWHGMAMALHTYVTKF